MTQGQNKAFLRWETECITRIETFVVAGMLPAVHLTLAAQKAVLKMASSRIDVGPGGSCRVVLA